jgi:capsular polysaccharide biosynthesis protein
VWPPAVIMLVGFGAALSLGTGAAFTADYLDPALRTPEEALECLEIPVLACIPEGMSRRLSA